MRCPSVYALKVMISIGIVITLVLGVSLLYVIVYAFVASGASVQVQPEYRNVFIFTFLPASFFLSFSSLTGIYGLLHRSNKMVTIYAVTIIIYFIIFVILSIILVQYPSQIQNKEDNQLYDSRIKQANETLCKKCQCYFSNRDAYSQKQNKTLQQMGFINFTTFDEEQPTKIQDCQQWRLEAIDVQIAILQAFFECSGWEVKTENNLYYIFTNVNLGIPTQNCKDALRSFFQRFGDILSATCLVVSCLLFLELIVIFCLFCHPEKTAKYDKLELFPQRIIENDQVFSKDEYI